MDFRKLISQLMMKGIMNENEKRIQIFDIAQGISIILMTIGRYVFIDIYPYLLQFQNVALFFRMPTFIFISGYLFSNRLDFKHFLYDKIDGLLKPLICFFISLTLLNIIFDRFVSEVVHFNQVFERIKSMARSFYRGRFDEVMFLFGFLVPCF